MSRACEKLVRNDNISTNTVTVTCILETRQNPPLTVQVAEQGGVGEVDLVPVVRVQSSSLILRLFIL